MFRAIDKTLLAITAIALAVAFGSVVVQHLYQQRAEAQIQALQSSVAHWQSAALSYKATADKLDALHQSANASVKALQAKLAEQGQRYKPLNRQLKNAPDTDDGEVAPVLRQALEGLP